MITHHRLAVPAIVEKAKVLGKAFVDTLPKCIYMNSKWHSGKESTAAVWA
jgi:hypothetical protein